MSQFSRSSFAPILYGAAVLTGIILFANLAEVIFIQDETTRLVFIDLLFPIINLLAAAALLFAALRSRVHSHRQALAWGVLALAQLCFTTADTLWAVLEIGLGELPFPSIADLFYLLFYPLFLLGILLLPMRRLTPDGWLKVTLDMSIVILIWSFLLVPQMAAGAGDPLINQLVTLAYPVGDLLLLWVLLLLLHSIPDGKNHQPLVLIAIGVGLMIIADYIYAYQALQETYASGGWLDLCWTITYLLFAWAGLWQGLTVQPATPEELAPQKGRLPYRSFWISFLPYAWVIVPFLMLAWSLDHELSISQPLLVLGGSVVIGLLLTRQVVTYRETRRRTAELQGLLDQVQRQDRENRILLASISSILVGLGPQDEVIYWNEVAAEVLKIPAGQALGRAFTDLPIDWNWEPVRQALAACRSTLQKTPIDEIHTSKGRLLAANITPILEDGSVSPRLLLLGSDITERRRMEQELAQARKLEAIGQLAAGIAHEINTPTQYVGANLRFMHTHLDSLLDALQGCQELVEAVQAGQPAGDLADRAALLSQEAQLEYLLQEFPSALNQSLDGIQRITHITGAMRTFSRPDTEQKTSANLNQILADTLIVARHQWKSLATLATDYDPDLPQIACYPAELSQAFLNLITNACDAIADALQDPQRPQPPGGMGTLSLSTRAAGSAAEVRIGDTGMGIPEHIQERIFDPFFTTKDPGKGTGQGLAIAYAIVVKKHGGALSFETQAGQGTTFTIRLPLP